MLVGAPLGQNLQPNTSRSGALWKCPLRPAVDDCEQIATDGKRSEFTRTPLNFNILTQLNMSRKRGHWPDTDILSHRVAIKEHVEDFAHNYVCIKITVEAQWTP